MTRKRILTGDRPTGKLHLGHYVGSLRNRVALQDSHDCFFIIADYHSLTTRPDKAEILAMRRHIREIVLDYLAVGIDPERSVIFLQSAVPETATLNLIFEMLVSVPRLERVPTIKQMAQDANLESLPFGLLGYPVLQTADILLPRAHLVPVAKDNESHVEVAREIARRFNRLYGEVFPVPETLLGDLLVGIDGKAKASKSLDNVIYLTENPEDVRRKVNAMYTDPKRVRADIPGRVEGNVVFIYHDAFNPDQEQVEHFKERYRQGKIGDVEVKNRLAEAINEFLQPIQQRREEFAQQEGFVKEILTAGTQRMREEAHETMAMVQDAMGYSTLRELVES